MKTKLVTDKRPLIDCVVNGIHAYFLLDTGASIALIDSNKKKRFGLKQGREYNGTIIGAGGEVETAYVCDSAVELQGIKITQFVFSDLESLNNSIKRETGYEILGIISYPQMQRLGITIDTFNSLITIFA